MLKKYHFIKKTTKSLIGASLLLLSLFAASLLVPAHKSEALGVCNVPALVSMATPTPEEVIVTAGRIGGQSAFDWRVESKDPAGTTTTIASGSIADPTSPINVPPIRMSVVGTYTITVSFVNKEDPLSPCSPAPIVQNFNYTTSATPLITVGANPGSINFTTKDDGNIVTPETTINFTFQHHDGEKYKAEINRCSNLGTFDQKEPETGFGTITAGSSYSFKWKPQEDATCIHTVRVSTYDAANAATGTGEARVSVYSHNDTPPTPPSAGGGNEGPDDGKYTPPTSIDVNLKSMKNTFEFPNTIRGVGDVALLVIKLLEYFIGILAFIQLLVGGMQYISSAGDATKAAKAKKTVIYSVIGIVLAVLSLFITQIVANFWAGPQ